MKFLIVKPSRLSLCSSLMFLSHTEEMLLICFISSELLKQNYSEISSNKRGNKKEDSYLKNEEVFG
jgi:hypothetical protein